MEQKTKKLVGVGLLTAIVVVLQALAVVIRPTGIFNISLVLVPIVVGAALYGYKAGAWLGFVFSLIVLATDSAAFMAISFPGTIITVLAKGTIAGLVAGLVYLVLEKKNRGLLCYILFALAIFGVTFGYRVIYLKTKSLEGILGVCYHYNHLLVLLASLGLFMAFLQWQPKAPKRLLLAKISSCTLGIYLLHENLGFRYAWPAWIGAKTVSSIQALLLKTVLAVALVFVAGILVEIIRKWIVLGIHKLLLHLPVYQRALKQMEKLDDLFAKKEPA